MSGGKQRTVWTALGIVGFMGAMSFASVPLYDLFCRVTGYGGTTQTAEAGAGEILDRTVKVRFDASLDRDMPWEFYPVQREIEIRIGETGLAFYRAHNPTSEPVAGTATFNVTPLRVGEYFVKIDCFCFQEQIIGPGETVDMPVTFYVDPEFARDEQTRDIPGVTLSYTFYRQDMPTGEAAVGRVSRLDNGGQRVVN